MTALELLNELQTYDIRLECVGDKLRVNAPVGVVIPELRSLLKEQKAALLALLSEGASQATSEDQDHAPQAISADQEHVEAIPAEDETSDEIAVECCVCGVMVEWCSEEGDAYCEAHWVPYLKSQEPPNMGYSTPLTLL